RCAGCRLVARVSRPARAIVVRSPCAVVIPGRDSGDARRYRMMVRAVICAAALFVPSMAFAGAWTLPQGQTQIISNVTLSRATDNFSDAGTPNVPVTFAKLWTSITGEYGLTGALTLNLEGE